MKKITIYSIIIFLIDVLLKLLITNNIEYNESQIIIPQFFYLSLVKNTGGAFSILNNNTLILIIISIILLILIFYYLKRLATLSKTNIISFSLLIGGALGNLYDRIVHGFVIDYLDFKVFGFNYPIFNFADIMIVCGTIILILFYKKADNKFDKR